MIPAAHVAAAKSRPRGRFSKYGYISTQLSYSGFTFGSRGDVRVLRPNRTSQKRAVEEKIKKHSETVSNKLEVICEPTAPGFISHVHTFGKTLSGEVFSHLTEQQDDETSRILRLASFQLM